MAVLTRRADGGFMPLRDAMNQLMAEAFAPFAASPLGNGAESGLPVNIYEDGEAYFLHVAVPGVNPEAVEITAANGVINLAVRQESLAKEGWKQLWQEFQPMEYRRQLRLPVEFDAGKIEATYESGVLQLRVPKAEHTRPRQIKVNVAK